jgi:hypothetical protein
MKYIVRFLFINLLLLFINTKAQIPNSSFETWVGGIPQSWSGVNVPGYPTILQTNFAHSGQSAFEGIVVLWQGVGLYTPTLYSDITTGHGISIAQRYNTLKGYYSFKPIGGDVIFINVVISNNNGVSIGGGNISISTASDNYIEFDVPITYYTQDNAAFCLITISIAGPSNSGEFHEGSTMYIDDLELSMDVLAGVENGINPVKFELNQNYPNPFNPSTIISYQLPVSSKVTLKVFNSLGEEIETLVNEEKPAGSYDVSFDGSRLSSGIYYFQIKTGSFIQTRKMLLLK